MIGPISWPIVKTKSEGVFVLEKKKEKKKKRKKVKKQKKQKQASHKLGLLKF